MFLPSCQRCLWRSGQLIKSKVSSKRGNRAPAGSILDPWDPKRHLTVETASHRLLDSYKQSIQFSSATHQIRDLSPQDIGAEVTLHGYLGPRSDLSKNLSFVPLFSDDLSTKVQLISLAKSSNGNASESHSLLKNARQHVPVVVTGQVKEKEKPKDAGTSPSDTHDQAIEINVTGLQILNDFSNDVRYTQDINISPEQRHLQIRQSDDLRQALVFRSRLTKLCRDFLTDDHGFTEVETPLLFKSTPEGAREFLVPTREKGSAYALPQSPQQYKQILMGSGIPKYFQVAKCFRDEDLRADRQPEFTQLDLEMAFATGQNVRTCIEGLIRHLWKQALGVELPMEPLVHMTYEDAMSKYGSDKPDVRLGMEIMRIGHLIPVDLVSKIGPLTEPIVEAFKLPVSEEPSETRQFVNEFMDSPEALEFMRNPDGQPGIFIYDSRKPLAGLQPFGFEAAEVIEEEMELEDGDLLVIQARKDLPFSGGSTPLGNLRLALHKAAVTKGYLPSPLGYQFLWIDEFPLFSPSNDTDPGQDGSAGFFSTHHPFTAPATTEDADLLSTDPTRAKADHYDLVLNGVELGGGSRRIHNAQFQEFILRDVLKISDDRLVDFKHLLDMLKAGCPPHAGIALGFDRLCAVMLGKESIRDVIAFPKSGKGEDLLVKSPSKMTAQQLDTYHLSLKD